MIQVLGLARACSSCHIAAAAAAAAAVAAAATMQLSAVDALMH